MLAHRVKGIDVKTRPEILNAELTVCESAANFKSEERVGPLQVRNALFSVVGEDLRSFSKADVSTFMDQLEICRRFKSEVNYNDLHDGLSRLGDRLREIPPELFDQLTHLSKMVRVLSDNAFVSSVKFDARFLADIASQLLIAFKLISLEPSMTNITLVFTCALTKLNLSADVLKRCLSFIQEAITIAIASISSLGFRSESAMLSFVETLKGFCGSSIEIVNDKVVDIVLTFLSKLVAFWVTLSGGFLEEDFDVSQLPSVIQKMRDILSGGGDIVECLLGAYEWVTQNFPKFVTGDFSGLFFGRAETSAFESRVSKVRKMYPLVKGGSTEMLKEEYSMTVSDYDAEVAELLRIGESMMKKAKPAQRPALKRYLDDLREVIVDRQIQHSQQQTKITALGVCFVGPSGVGKSFLMDQTSRTLIASAGEVPTKDKIVTGQMSDKFDSNELNHHLSIQYDDVANNSHNENFDKLLNAVNSQARPFLKAGVDEKGVMFPGNVACVISTNVPGFNAHKSNCPDSLGRRFLHIETSIKEHLIPEVCVSATARIDTVKVNLSGKPRYDIWKFNVYEFKTYDYDPEDIPKGMVVWNKMLVEKILWTEKSERDYTFWDLAAYLSVNGKKHFASQEKTLLSVRSAQDSVYCTECCIPAQFCSCGTKSEFFSGDIDIGLNRLIAHYNVYHEGFHDWYHYAKVRAIVTLTFSLCPINYKRTYCFALAASLLLGLALDLPMVLLTMFVVSFSLVCVLGAVYYSWRCVYHRVATRVGILTHLADDSMEVMREYRNRVFAGLGMVSFAYLIYRSFRPKSEFMSYRNSLPEHVRQSFVRAEEARTTPVDNIMPHIKRDLGVIKVEHNGEIKECLAFPIESNFYLTVGHLIPKGEFTVTISHENGLTPTVAKQKLSDAHVYRFPNKDLALVQIPSSAPRKGYKNYLLGRSTFIGSQAVNIVTMDPASKVRSVQPTRMEEGWSMVSSTVRTDKVTLHKPYRYQAPLGTRDGMCGSPIVDYSKAIIYGFHVAGDGRVGLCDTIAIEDIDAALASFKGFIPLNQGELQLGSNSLVKDLGYVSLEINDPVHDKPIEEHNCITEGVLPGNGATFRHPYRKHPYKKEIVEQFGEPTFGPPQEINSHFHKRKALTKLTSPNQEFSMDELEFAADDYMKPIISHIAAMPAKERAEIGRPLSLQEALDGIGDRSMGGIDNSTSCGFPLKGKKKDYLVRDTLDPSICAVPRQLVTSDGIDIEAEMAEMISRYRLGVTARPLYKCSMKTNELLSKSKVKARVFMGSNFPFLLLCRQYLAPIIRIMSKNKFLFETAKGINMDSVEAEELYNYLLVEGGTRVVPLDYAAFDQSMSAQASTTAAGEMIDLMHSLGCSNDHILVARGLLTDITYPNLHFFGTVMQLANSDPSGNPLTTELNGMVNSLYLRVFFFRIYARMKTKVTYRDAIRTMTFGDDNINGVFEAYKDFNATNIIAEGKKVGLAITMAEKDAAVVDFLTLEESDFLKRKFRYCPDLGRIRAPLAKSSIEKSVHWMKTSSPDPPDVLFSQTVDGMLRKSSQHGREYFESIRQKLLHIATVHDVIPLCKWWSYDELIEHDRKNYYDEYRGHHVDDTDADLQILTDFLSQSKRMKKRQWLRLLVNYVLLFGYVAGMSLSQNPVLYAKVKRFTLRMIRYIEKNRSDKVADYDAAYSMNGLSGILEMIGVPTSGLQGLLSGLASVRLLFNRDDTFGDEDDSTEGYPRPIDGDIEGESPSPDPVGVDSDDAPTTFKSESFTRPIPPQSHIAVRLLTMIMEWIVACIPILNTGRFAEIGMRATGFRYGMIAAMCAQYYIDTTKVHPAERTNLFRYGYRLKEQIIQLYLRESNELIRRQAYCVYLYGKPGAGKTTCAIQIMKHLIPDISRKDVIVLNEDDAFQSELRSNHKVIILDDVGNTRHNHVQCSPLRRIIDMVNNTPRRALSPEADMKGSVTLNPLLVIVNSNIPPRVLAETYSACPDALYRRWKSLLVRKHRPFVCPMDTSSWTFNIPKEAANYADIAHNAKYDVDFPQLMALLKTEYDDHNRDQQGLVDMVNSMVPEPTWLDFVKSCCAPAKFKSETLDWDAEMIKRLQSKEVDCHNFLELVEETKREMLEEHALQDFESLPSSVEPILPRVSWCDRIKMFFGLGKFRSEAKVSKYEMPMDIPDNHKALIMKLALDGYHPDLSMIITPNIIISLHQNEVYPMTAHGIKIALELRVLYAKKDMELSYVAEMYPDATIRRWISTWDEEAPPRFRSEALSRSKVPKTLTDEQLVRNVLEDEVFIEQYVTANLEEILYHHYVYVQRFSLQSELPAPPSPQRVQASPAASITQSQLDRFDDLISGARPESPQPIVCDNMHPAFRTYSGFNTTGWDGLTVGICPSRQEHEAQIKGHNAMMDDHPKFVLVGRELTYKEQSIDLLYRRGSDYFILECKERSLSKCKVQSQKKASALRSEGVDVARAYAYAADQLVRTL